jgi:hypothetical protein
MPGNIEVRLGTAFCLLIAILIALGDGGIDRMDRIHANFDEVLARHWSKLETSREALRYSSLNSRIIMEIFLLREGRRIGPLLRE